MELRLSELETLFEKIKNILSKFEKNYDEYYEDKSVPNYKYKLFLTNGDKINLSIPASSVPHLLGIDTNYLSSLEIFKSTNSFEIAKEMCENAYKINKLVNEGKLKYDNFLSQFVQEKVNGILPNIYFNINEFELIVKYDPSKSYEITDKNQKFDYIIIKKFEDDKIGILGIIKNEYNYVPMSNRIYNNLEEAKEFLNEILNGQEITMINGMQISNRYSDYNKSFNLSLNSKLDKLDRLKYYNKTFNAHVDVLSDYEWALSNLSNRRQEKFTNSGFIDSIAKSIAEGEIINTEELEDNNLIEIVNAFNDFVCKESNNSGADIKYSEVIKELKELRSEAENLRREKEELQSNLNKEQNKNEQLQLENKELIDTKQKVLSLLLPKKDC